jgi:Na+/alanine symporter
MYLLARQANLRGLDSQAWAVKIGAAAAEGLGNEVGVWATVLSPGFGTVTWTSRWADLVALEKGFAEVSVNAKYLGLAAEGAAFVNGPINDTLYEVAYEGSSPIDDARYVGTVTAVCAPGHFARGIMGGLEIAQRAEKATGVSTSFLTGQTGAYGTVVWLAGYKDIAEFEKAQHALAADMSFIEYIDTATDAYQADPSLTQSTLYMRIS